VNRILRILFNIAAFLSLPMSAAAMWWATPDKTTTTRVVLTTEQVFDETMPRDRVSSHLIGGRAGHYLVELPGESYGQLFVPIGNRQVSLQAALFFLLMLPTIWCITSGGRMIYRARDSVAVTHLKWLSAGVSFMLVLFLAAWCAWWPAPNRVRAHAVAGNGWYLHYLDKHPSAWPTEPDYSFNLFDFTIPFAGIIVIASIWPLVTVILWSRQRVFAYRTNQIGRCAKCGYDLRATPHRCPECGEVPSLQ
jgi:hypothetical protein